MILTYHRYFLKQLFLPCSAVFNSNPLTITKHLQNTSSDLGFKPSPLHFLLLLTFFFLQLYSLQFIVYSLQKVTCFFGSNTINYNNETLNSWVGSFNMKQMKHKDELTMWGGVIKSLLFFMLTNKVQFSN